jgi:HEPN domain-containing protein
MVKEGHFDWALFVGRLALEKILKGLFVNKSGNLPPPIHDLVKLSALAGVDLSQEQKEDLARIARFNIAARYDDIKVDFFHEATKDFTNKWMEIIIKYYLWFKKLY